MKVHTTNLQALYQDGHLRYLQFGDEEIVRMIYPALRNWQWYTIPMTIFDEKIEQHPGSFSIHYSAQYKMDDIEYEATVTINGDEDDVISFHFKGKARCQFLKNRIGICVHHPIKECLSQPGYITQPNGEVVETSFSTLIEPFILFGNIQKLSWKTLRGVDAFLEFDGDVFESEDQRNWSDSSFKTYSTPVGIPYPVMVQPGEIVEQKVILTIGKQTQVDPEKTKEKENTEQRIPFPTLGYSRSNTSLSDLHIHMLKQIIFDHYRIEIDFKTGWIEQLSNAHAEATELNTKLELVVLFDDYMSEYEQLKSQLNTQIASLLIIQKSGHDTSPAVLDYMIPRIRQEFPFIKIGGGTNNHFVDINRNRVVDQRLDFLSYGVTPQAHLPFRHILVENLEALQYPITTLRSFTNKDIHVSPITLKARDYPDYTIDERQHTEFIAYWTAISLKYLAGVHHLTLFETVGHKGIINEEGPSPVYDLLKKISTFRPKFIIKTHVDHPLKKDCLILENEGGERLNLEVDF